MNHARSVHGNGAQGLVVAVTGFLALMAGSASAAACEGGYASALTITGAVSTPKTYSLADLQAFQPSKQTVTWYSGKDGFVTESYIGVPLIDLINAAGVVTNPNQKNDILRAMVIVTATDCYQATISMGEILPSFGGQQAIVAYADGDGTPLGPDEGLARIIMPSDKAGGRDIFHARTLTVRFPSRAPQAGLSGN